MLQGDELRSILEAMPLLAEGLAKELGVSIGELRKLGSEGKLTAERVFPALLRATERLGAELDRAPPRPTPRRGCSPCCARGEKEKRRKKYVGGPQKKKWGERRCRSVSGSMTSIDPCT